MNLIKIRLFVLVLIMTFVLTACSNKNSNNSEISNIASAPPVSPSDNNTTSTPNTDTPSVSNFEPSNEAIKELFERAAKKLIQYYVNEPGRELERDFDDKIEVDFSKDIMINEHPYRITNAKYKQAVDKYSELFTEDALKKFLSKYFYDVDGVLYINSAGGMSGFGIDNVKVTYAGNSNGGYLYNVTFDMIYGFEEPQHEPMESKFSVKKVENDYRISDIDYLLDS